MGLRLIHFVIWLPCCFIREDFFLFRSPRTQRHASPSDSPTSLYSYVGADQLPRQRTLSHSQGSLGMDSEDSPRGGRRRNHSGNTLPRRAVENRQRSMSQDGMMDVFDEADYETDADLMPVVR